MMRNKNKKFLLDILLVISLSLALLTCATGTVKAFEGGDGTSEDPYQIGNVTQLQNMSSDLTAHYVLVDDVDASGTSGWNEGNGFDPIGDSITKFTGSFDGNGYNITDLYINRPTNKVGLFGVLDGTVANVSLKDVNITGSSYVGGLAGEYSIDVAAVVNSSVTGEVTAEFDIVGGLIGFNSYHAVVKNCYSTANVTGRINVGGLIGYNADYAVVKNCYSTANVTGLTRVGGLIGRNRGTVNKTYAAGNVTATETSSSSDSGGLVGFHDGVGVYDSYWDTEETGQTTGIKDKGGTSSNVFGLTTSEMTGDAAETNMSLLDFNDIWETTDSYPTLQAPTKYQTQYVGVILSVDVSETYSSQVVELIRDLGSSIDIDGVPEVSNSNIYQYVNMSLNITNSTIDVGDVSANITFTVNKTWIDDVDAEPSDIVLRRYHDGEWVELETERIGETDTDYRYRAQTPGFSYFAIGTTSTSDTIIGGTTLNTSLLNVWAPYIGFLAIISALGAVMAYSGYKLKNKNK